MSYSKIMKCSAAGSTTTADGIVRDCDNAFIPDDPLNVDWQAYQAWLTAGNTPAEPDTPRSDPPAAKA